MADRITAMRASGVYAAPDRMERRAMAHPQRPASLRIGPAPRVYIPHDRDMRCGARVRPRADAGARGGAMTQGVQTQYDIKGQYERVLPQLLKGEARYAVFDRKGSGSGFVVATDRRLIFMDQHSRDRQDMAPVTIPYAQIS